MKWLTGSALSLEFATVLVSAAAATQTTGTLLGSGTTAMWVYLVPFTSMCFSGGAACFGTATSTVRMPLS
jgi:hypothetical protein